MKLAAAPGQHRPRSLFGKNLSLRASNAWSSRDPDGVPNCYEEDASLTVDRGTPSSGRAELVTTAAGYMAAIPDLHLSVDHVFVGDSVFWIWTLTGTNTGSGGNGRVADHRRSFPSRYFMKVAWQVA
ncbi:MAG: nuclear transport factor 2 family protein [Candidatus Dormibacteraeota bacterium]|nr:nuclear transport factor 2 family protein [Candidatus Dormibacteraeota bacterium]